ncbi:hypothetical protein Tco_0736037 [Tanacetum coccineum]
MAVLESCPKHNMVAYLEKTDGNAEFHEIIDFLARSSIHNALTVSLVVSTTFVKQFWMSAKSKIINNVRYITAKVAGKPVSISKASIRSDLLFYDADGIDSLPNQAIFDAIQLMGYEGDLTLTINLEPSPTTHHSDSIPEDSGGNHGGQSSNDRSLSGNEGGKISGKEVLEETVDAKGVSFDELADDTFDYMDTENAQDVGRTRNVVYKEKESAKDAVSTKDVVSTDKEKEEVSIFRPDEGTDDQTKGRYDPQTRPTTTTPSIFGDDETIAQLKDVEETERPRATSTRSLLTLKPLPKIDPKDKGKKKIEEEDESDMNLEARIKADRLLALRLQDEEREQFTMEERAKFLHDTIAAQRRFLAEQRAIAIRNRPPTRTQLESDDDLFESLKRFDESFTAVGSTEDERKIKEMNEGAKDLEQKRLKKKVVKETSKKEDTAKVPTKVDVTEQDTKKRKGGHMKMIARKRKRPQPDVDSDDEHRKCLKIITFEGTIDSEVIETKYVIARLNKVSSPDRDYLVIYRANGNFRAFNLSMEITLEGIELGIDILELKDGTVIHMLVERRYPLSKDLLQMMLDLGLEVERESTAALDLIIFIKQ